MNLTHQDILKRQDEKLRHGSSTENQKGEKIVNQCVLQERSTLENCLGFFLRFFLQQRHRPRKKANEILEMEHKIEKKILLNLETKSFLK